MNRYSARHTQTRTHDRVPYDGQPLRTTGTNDVIHPLQVPAENNLKQEQHRRKRLVLGGSTDPTRGQTRDKRGYIGSAEITWVTLAVKHDEPANPSRVRLVCPRTEVPEPHRLPNFVE